MTPAAPQYGSDSELQADVMRFMAIIAFCLIAILALVRNVTPPSPEDTPPLPAPEPAPIPEPPQAAIEPTPAAPVPEPAAPARPAVRQPEPAATPPVSPQPVPQPAAPKPVLTTPPARATVAERAPETPPAPAAEPAKQEGLTLRFASDGDFLRLIAKGDIRVYAYREGDVLTLSESYQFLETRAPGQIYELLDGSIPALVTDALRRTRPDVTGYRWGVVLPGRISHQIETFVGQVDSGQLVIDRFGDVHHVAAS